MTPEFAARVRAVTRVEGFAGGAVPNLLRKPYGPGWALVGDAGYTQDPITAQGMSDAFRDAELCAAALDEALRGTASFDDALSAYQLTRDTQVLPVHDFTAQLATLTPPPPEVAAHLLAAVAGNTEAMNTFAGVIAGTVSPIEFFASENIGRILGAAPV